MREKQETQTLVCRILVPAYTKRFIGGHWSLLGPWMEEKWYGTHTYKPNGLWNRVADLMMISLREGGQPNVQRNKCVWPKDFWKSEEAKKLRFTTTVTQRQQRCCSASILPSISSVSLGTFDLVNSSHTWIQTINIVVWETLHINANWDCFKILILQETLKTQIRHQVDSYAFSEAKHFVWISRIWWWLREFSAAYVSLEGDAHIPMAVIVCGRWRWAWA